MLPGKKYLPEDYLRIVWARKWWLIVPAVVVSTAVAIYAQLLPNRYRATALVQVVGQQVPENLIQPTVTDTVSERLRAIEQTILTRTRLERIIDEFGLYARERDSEIMQDIVDRMRTRDLTITINTPRGRRADASSFNIGFTSEQPRTARDVADRLAALFVEENLLNRGNQAQSTSQFMQATLDDARRRLQEQEERLAEFRREHEGRLPTQTSSNLEMMRTRQAQIQANVDAASKERDRLLALEGQLAELSVNETTIASLTPMAQQLAKAQAGLEALKLRLAAGHPEVRAAARLIEELQVKADEEALAAPLAPEAVAGAAPASRDGTGAANRLADLRAQIQQLRGSLERRDDEDARLRKDLAVYAARLESTPAVEALLAELTRDYATMRASYEDLLKRSQTARLAETLERQQIGEQFKIIDYARLPERPTSPDRVRMNLLGLAAGLGLGLALVGLLEYRDTTFKSDNDVLISLSLPVLAVIPAMMNHLERARRRRQQRLIAVAATLVVGLVGATAVAWQYGVIQNWIR